MKRVLDIVAVIVIVAFALGVVGVLITAMLAIFSDPLTAGSFIATLLVAWAFYWVVVRTQV